MVATPPNLTVLTISPGAICMYLNQGRAEKFSGMVGGGGGRDSAGGGINKNK